MMAPPVVIQIVPPLVPGFGQRRPTSSGTGELGVTQVSNDCPPVDRHVSPSGPSQFSPLGVSVSDNSSVFEVPSVMSSMRIDSRNVNGAPPNTTLL